MSRRKPAAGSPVSQRSNSRSGAVGSHPGATDRMAGDKKQAETGSSHPAYLPRGRKR